MEHYHFARLIYYSPITVLALAAVRSVYSDPFGRMHRVKNPFTTSRGKQGIELKKNFNLAVDDSFLARVFAYYKCAWHISSSVYIGGKKSKGRSVEAIERGIHELWFDPDKPYLISGEHFRVLYPRNLGVFYHAMLDPRTALDASDWEHRQRLYLQTAAYALEAFRERGDSSTTVVPIGSRVVSCINIYSYPSDALYGILYALMTLCDNSDLFARYPYGRSAYALETKDAADELIAIHRDTLERLVHQYVERVFDVDTMLVRRGMHLSSAKDMAKRESAFYDNVILWKTLMLARSIGIVSARAIDVDALKERIIGSFWDDERGYFFEDFSPEARIENQYSADWLAALFTGFLEMSDPAERRYFKRAADFTIDRGIDLPFPLRYQEQRRRDRQHLLVRAVVPSYGEGIWSFWGAEFIKLLALLGMYEDGDRYLERASAHVAKYEENIMRYRGYPEVYRSDGTMLVNPLYKSIRQTGWIVDFEQARALLRAASKKI